MKIIQYATGEKIMKGDRILYVGEPALIEHVTLENSPSVYDRALDSGGIFVLTRSGVRYGLEWDEIEEAHCDFVKRASDDPEKTWQADWVGPQMGGSESGSWKLF